MKPITLEEEIRKRHEAMENLELLLDELRKTCMLFIDKYNRTGFLSVFDEQVLSQLCVAMEMETVSIKKLADKLLAMQRDMILPLKCCDLTNAMEEISDNIMQISKFIDFKYRTEVDSYIVAEEVMMTSLFELEMEGKFTLTESKAIFQSMLSRYEKDNEDVLSFYAGEIDDLKEARKQLREEYKDDKAVKLWRENAGCIEKTIDAMRNSSCEELDLLPLFAYVARRRLLDGMANGAGNQRVTVIENHFHEGSQNVEHIENQINTLPPAPPKGGVQEYRAWGEFLEQNK